MAIYTLSTSANYSAIKGSLANGDTIRIDTNAVRLTINEQPLLTNITVDSPGVSGRMTVSGAYNLSTWSIIAGTATLIDGTFPAGATLGSATGGSAFSVAGVATNAGTITTANGGSASNSYGVTTNNGTITTANGGTTASSFGVLTNNGTIATANGGSSSFAEGVITNNGTITTANGGTASSTNAVRTNAGTITNANGGSGSSSFGVTTNNATVGTATGGSGASAHGVSQNNSAVTKGVGGSVATAQGVSQCDGICLEATDNTGRGVNNFRGGPKLINGPEFKTATTNYSNVPRIYSIGQVSGSAAIPGTIPITILSEGSGGFTGIKGIDRYLGT